VEAGVAALFGLPVADCLRALAGACVCGCGRVGGPFGVGCSERRAGGLERILSKRNFTAVLSQSLMTGWEVMVGSGGDELWCTMFYGFRRAFLTTSSTFRVWGDA
jgi:hypothetical protein